MADDHNLNGAAAQIERAQVDKCLRPSIAGFFDEATNTVSYVVHDPTTDEAAIIDSVLDFEVASGRTSNGSADRIIEYVTYNNLKVTWLIETHAHADHISAAPYLQERLGGKLAIGRGIIRVQEVFGKLFNAGTDFERDGSQFDKLFEDGETFRIGELEGIANRTDFDLSTHAKHSGKDLSYYDQAGNERYTPYVIEPAAGLSRSLMTFLVDAYHEDEAPNTKGGVDKRTVLRLDPRLAPVKVAVLPLSRNADLSPKARDLAAELRKHWYVDFDDAGAIGKRYRRQDEIGTPYCVTVDFDTLEDGAVTVRERDTMQQERIAIDGISGYFAQRFLGA